jgi:hypothetical protein
MMDAKFYVNWFVGSWMCDNIGRYISWKKFYIL